MKNYLKINSIRHTVRIFCALVASLVVNYYLASTKEAWLPLATLIVMLTPTGSALYQGLWRFFLLSSAVIIVSLIFSPIRSLYMRMYDVVLGAVIGIAFNVILFPDKVDIEFRNAFVPILRSYSLYFSSLVSLLLDKNSIDAEKEKVNVEEKLMKLPAWVYEAGFDLTLQKGYRYFFMKVGQIGEILFAMHHLARFTYPDNLLNTIREPLLQCIVRVEQFIAAIITVLELKKLSVKIIDFDLELAEIESQFKEIVSSAMDSVSPSTDLLYLTEFIYNLQELRNALLRLTQTLR